MDVGPACQPRSPLVFRVGAEPHFPCLEQFPTEEEEQEIKNLFEKVMKQNLPNLAKEIAFQEDWEAQRVRKEVGPKEAHTKTHHNYITQD